MEEGVSPDSNESFYSLNSSCGSDDDNYSIFYSMNEERSLRLNRSTSLPVLESENSSWNWGESTNIGSSTPVTFDENILNNNSEVALHQEEIISHSPKIHALERRKWSKHDVCPVTGEASWIENPNTFELIQSPNEGFPLWAASGFVIYDYEVPSPPSELERSLFPLTLPITKKFQENPETQSKSTQIKRNGTELNKTFESHPSHNEEDHTKSNLTTFNVQAATKHLVRACSRPKQTSHRNQQGPDVPRPYATARSKSLKSLTQNESVKPTGKLNCMQNPINNQKRNEWVSRLSKPRNITMKVSQKEAEPLSKLPTKCDSRQPLKPFSPFNRLQTKTQCGFNSSSTIDKLNYSKVNSSLIQRQKKSIILTQEQQKENSILKNDKSNQGTYHRLSIHLHTDSNYRKKCGRLPNNPIVYPISNYTQINISSFSGSPEVRTTTKSIHGTPKSSKRSQVSRNLSDVFSSLSKLNN